MYKLLLATDIQSYADMVKQTELFEIRGFKVPVLAETPDKAIGYLINHHVDAIAYHFSRLTDDQTLYGVLQAKYQTMPIFCACQNTAEQGEVLSVLKTLLNRMHEDYSNDKYNEADMLSLCRHAFFRRLLSESITSRKQLELNLLLLRSTMDPCKSCMVIDMELPAGEEYLSEKWHYGADRLEIALRNFFGREMRGMRILPSVIAPDMIRLLACPLIDSTDNDSNDQSVTEEIYEHVKNAIQDVKDYLLLDIRIKNVKIMPDLFALVTKAAV